MTGVPTTQANLITQFPTAIGAGRFGAQAIQNLIASVPNFATQYNAKNYGAVGNGSSNPASSVYGSLGALQAVYGTTVGGVAIALTNELDWLAHQKIIDVLHAANGGEMFSPTGKYVYSNSNSPADRSGILIFPETGTVDSGALPQGVNWTGEGFNVTLHTWPTDLGVFKAISSITWSASVATVTTSAPHGLTNPSTQRIRISGTTPAGYGNSGNWIIATVTGTSTFTYPLEVNPGAETVPGTYLVATFAVTCTNRMGTNIGAVGYWREMSFYGPSIPGAAGTRPANMHGLGWAEYRLMNQVRVLGFDGGICLNAGGQTPFDTVYTDNCFYGFYFDGNNTFGDHGDQFMKNCSATNCRRAGIGIASDCHIISTVWKKAGMFTSPFGIFKELGSDPNVSDIFALEDTTFEQAQFENLGNGLFSDGLAAGSHLALFSGEVKFRDVEWFYGGTWNDPALPSTCVFGLSSSFGSFIVDGIFNASGWTFANTLNGVFEIDNGGAQVQLKGDLATLFINMAGVAPLATGFFHSFNIMLENTGNFPWQGVALSANGTFTHIIGSVLRISGSGRTAELAQGTATEQVLGICTLTNAGVSGGVVCVAQHGFIETVSAGSNVIAVNDWCRAGSGGVAITSTGIAQTTSRNIGKWLFASGSAPNFVGQVWLQGLT